MRIILVQADHFLPALSQDGTIFLRLGAAVNIQLSTKSLGMQRPAKVRLKRRALARNLQNNEDIAPSCVKLERAAASCRCLRCALKRESIGN